MRAVRACRSVNEDAIVSDEAVAGR